jgi:hypothetical protein
MATTFTKIADVTVGSGGSASIDFSSIPSTYTDLCIKLSVRSSSGTDGRIKFNSSSDSTYSMRSLRGDGSTAGSASESSQTSTWLGNVGNASDTFNSMDIYIPNYAGSTVKSMSIDNVSENNGTTAYAILIAGLRNNTDAITSISIFDPYFTFQQYSTATLYGVNNA